MVNVINIKKFIFYFLFFCIFSNISVAQVDFYKQKDLSRTDMPEVFKFKEDRIWRKFVYKDNSSKNNEQINKKDKQKVTKNKKQKKLTYKKEISKAAPTNNSTKIQDLIDKQRKEDDEILNSTLAIQNKSEIKEELAISKEEKSINHLAQKEIENKELKNKLTLLETEKQKLTESINKLKQKEKNLAKIKDEEELAHKFADAKSSLVNFKQEKSKIINETRAQQNEKIDFLTQKLYQQGTSKLTLGKIKEAEDTLKKLLMHNPTYHPARELLATLFFKAGNLKEAYQLLQLGLLQDPKNINYTILLARVLINMNYNSESIKILEKNAPNIANNEEYFAMLTALYMEKKDYESAYLLYAELVKNYPMQAKYYLGLGLSSEQLNKKQEAFNSYQKVLNLRNIDMSTLKFVQKRIDSLSIALNDELLISPLS